MLKNLKQEEINLPYRSGKLPNLHQGAVDRVLAFLILVGEVEKELEAVKRERDAAVFDLGEDKMCGSCKYRDNENKCNGTNCYTCQSSCPCAQNPCWYKWRGVCPENTEVQDG